jgi:aminoglycoside N3'-acetyltransferase
MVTITRTSYQDILTHLKDLNINQGDKIVVHSSLFALGVFDIEDIAGALFEAVGKTGCVIVPTYTFSISSPDFYDPKTSLCEVGELGNWFIRQKGAVRSVCPLHNHTGIGPDAQNLLAIKGDVSLGHGSDFDLFYKNNYKLLLLGTSFAQAATYLHHVEACVDVPYREWIALKRLVKDGSGEIHSVECNYFARKEDAKETDFDLIKAHLGERMVTAQLPYGFSHCIDITALHECAEQLLKEDPYFFASKRSSLTESYKVYSSTLRLLLFHPLSYCRRKKPATAILRLSSDDFPVQYPSWRSRLRFSLILRRVSMLTLQ